MQLKTQITDSSFDLMDAIAYEFFMDNLSAVMDDFLNDPDSDSEIANEKILKAVELIGVLAEMAYGIAGKYDVVRTEFKKLQHDRNLSD